MAVQRAEELPRRDVPQLAARLQRLSAHVRHHQQHNVVEETGRGGANWSFLDVEVSMTYLLFTLPGSILHSCLASITLF